MNTNKAGKTTKKTLIIIFYDTRFLLLLAFGFVMMLFLRTHPGNKGNQEALNVEG
jgi:hypothetical protein